MSWLYQPLEAAAQLQAAGGGTVTQVAGSLTITGGTHTAAKQGEARQVTHVAASATATGGTHLRALTRALTAAAATATGGTHTRVLTLAATAASATATGGTHSLTHLQHARPASDITVGGWTDQDGNATALWEALNEITASDTDYDKSGVAPSSDLMEVKLSALTDPASSSGHVLRYRYAKSGSNTINLVVKLMCGASTIATWNHNGVSETYTTAEQTLSGAEADAISDYSDLRFRVEATQA